jgi:6-phosphogluconolactonase
VDATGNHVMVANYGGGSVLSLPIQPDGGLTRHTFLSQHTGGSRNPARQKDPHAHSVNLSPDNRFAYVADLGTDRIHAYVFESARGLTAAKPHLDTRLMPGSGPRHFTFSPDGHHAYVINEMTLKVNAFRVDAASGALAEVQSLSTLPKGTDPVGSTAEVVAHPSGKFLYGSNRGHDSIVVYAIDGATGQLTWVENEPIRGKTPRNFAIDPSGKWLLAAGQDSHGVSLFSIDQSTGKLSFTGRTVPVPAPVCITFR